MHAQTGCNNEPEQTARVMSTVPISFKVFVLFFCFFSNLKTYGTKPDCYTTLRIFLLSQLLFLFQPFILTHPCWRRCEVRLEPPRRSFGGCLLWVALASAEALGTAVLQTIACHLKNATLRGLSFVKRTGPASADLGCSLLRGQSFSKISPAATRSLIAILPSTSLIGPLYRLLLVEYRFLQDLDPRNWLLHWFCARHRFKHVFLRSCLKLMSFA